jgi:hypothetical protein
MHFVASRNYSALHPAPHRIAMLHTPFVDSASSLPGEDPGEPLEPSAWERLLMVALVVTVAACSAAVLMQ